MVMSLARRLGSRVEKGTLLECLPIELREELYRRVYHNSTIIQYKPYSNGGCRMVIGDVTLSIGYTVSLKLLKEFIHSIFQGTSVYFQKGYRPEMYYHASVDYVTISGHWVDKDGWIHIRGKTVAIPVCIDLMQVLIDLHDDLYNNICF